MPTEIKMPQLGESVTEGTVGRWLKQPGDHVEKYEPLLEVVTDKVDTEVPSPFAGTLLEILVPTGETVRVGTVLARLGTADEANGIAQAAGRAHATVSATASNSVPHSARAASSNSVPHSAPTAASNSVKHPAPPREGHAQVAALEGADASGSRNTTISPVVARLLAEHNLDVSQIPGTGAGGRVSKQDVLRYLEQRQGAAAAPALSEQGAAEVIKTETQAAFEAAPPTPSSRKVPAQVPPVPSSREVPAQAPPRPAPAPLPADAELVPLTPMRRMIAEHMTRSVRTSPHVTSVVEVDMSRVVAHREQQRAAFERQGVRLTFTPYIVQAVVAALQAVPVLNGSFTDEGIVIHRDIHVGVAVSLEEGLIVPVIRNADEKNLLGLARAVNDLAERARTRRLRPDETQGGTFTITNHGVSGSLFATPIINQPQAGILGVGAIQKRPVVVTQEGVDAIAIKPMCYCSLTFDHRITDGATADAFLMTVKQAIEQYA